MKYILSFIKIGSGIHKLIRGDTQIHEQHGGRVSLLLFFQNDESRLKVNTNFGTASLLPTSQHRVHEV
jgi:hypothetical protein